jgi:hypothetical protein
MGRWRRAEAVDWPQATVMALSTTATMQ